LISANTESERRIHDINEELADIFRQETEAVRAKAHLSEVFAGIERTILYLKKRAKDLTDERERLCTHDFASIHQHVISCKLCGLTRYRE
jgi:hypothetical protein